MGRAVDSFANEARVDVVEWRQQRSSQGLRLSIDKPAGEVRSSVQLAERTIDAVTTICGLNAHETTQ
jgi:hypothetical protein